MGEILNDFRSVTLPIHIGFGFFVLALFWLQVFSRKGSRWHVRAGKAFYWSGLIIVVTAIFGVAAVLIDAFTGDHDIALNDARLAAVFFLGYLAIITFAILEKGRSAIRFRGPSPGARSVFAYVRAFAALPASLALISYAIAFRPSNMIILLALSPLGVFIFMETQSFQKKGNDYSQRWVVEHMDGMLGAGIAFHTAFFVFGASSFFNPLLAGTPLQLLPWILPTLVGVPAGVIWKRKLLRQSGAGAAE